MPEAQPRQRAEDFLPLSEFERRLLQRLASNPGEWPPEFWAAVSSKMEISQPQLLAESISGIKGEETRMVGAAGQPAFQNSWTNYGNPWMDAGFYKAPNGRVYLMGLVAGGGADLIFTLPEGYRPQEDLVFAVSTDDGAGGNAYGRVDVSANGDVSRIVGGTAFVSLNVNFRAA